MESLRIDTVTPFIDIADRIGLYLGFIFCLSEYAD